MRTHDEEERDEIQPVEETAEAETEEHEYVDADQLAEDFQALQSELEQLRTDVENQRDAYLRTLADFDNYRKRQREEAQRMQNVAREDIICKLLPIVDNFQRALAAAEEQQSFDALKEGVSLTLRQIMSMLEQEGVEPIESVGQEFNPEFHEAMMRVETDEYPENTVVDEFETGYTMNGKVLRPAKVRVASSD